MISSRSLAFVTVVVLLTLPPAATAQRPSRPDTARVPPRVIGINDYDGYVVPPPGADEFGRTYVEELPVPLRREQPAYPEAARRAGLAGRVIVKVRVERNGAVSDARVVRSAGRILDRAALGAARRWRFRPAQLNGVPVATWVTLPPFRFPPRLVRSRTFGPV
jgi:TonB family protein